MVLISYMGNEGPDHFVFCFYKKVCKCTFGDVMAIFF